MACIQGDPVDRVPVALWRHWQGDDQRSADLARAIYAFQEHFDWDFVTVLPAHHFSVIDHGLQVEWQGDSYGKYEVIRPVVTRSLHWTELRARDPARGTTGKQLECLRLLGNAFDAIGTPYIQVIYSPLAQAVQLAGHGTVIQHLRTHPDRVRTGLNTLTESTLRFVEALRRTNIAGIFYVTALASYQYLTEAEYAQIALPYDARILEMLAPSGWWLNGISVPGPAPMIGLFTQMPVQILHWDSARTHPDLDRGPGLFARAICGGLDTDSLHTSAPSIIRDAGREALRLTAHRRFILSAGEPVKVTTPLSNMQAVRDVVEPSGR